MNLTLRPPQSSEKDKKRTKVMRLRSFKLSDEQRTRIETNIKKWYAAWERGTGPLRRRLQEANDHIENIVEDVDFPWPGASKVTMGLASGHARTVRAIFDRSVFPDHRPFAVESLGDVKSEDRNLLEIGANWLARRHNNLVKELRNTPIPCFRDGTVPVMGDWKRRIEKVFEVKHYFTADEFITDYPDEKTAGISQERYDDILSHVSQMDNALAVEYQTDKVLYDGPWFKAFALARLIWYPVVGIEELDEAKLYGRLYYAKVDDLRARAKREDIDDKIMSEIIQKGSINHDPWGISQDQIDGLNFGVDESDKELVKMARLVYVDDLDNDDIPERYWVDYAPESGKVLSAERYKLRNNINCVVLFRFLRRDGRLLGLSLCLDGLDAFKMVDSLHRHRNNVRAITDCPVFIAPEALKESLDLGSGPSAIRPGVTFWLEDRYLKEGMGPRQLLIQSLSKTNESLDEEQGVVRYLEFRLGPSMGQSGQESVSDPRAPASKTQALMRQAGFRTDDLLKEWKNSVPEVLDLMSALYYLYGDDSYQVGQEDGVKDPIFKELKRTVWAYDQQKFIARQNETSFSPEFEMDKVLSLAAIAAQNPLLLQIKPEINLLLWNDLILASRVADPKRFMIDLPDNQSTAEAKKTWSILKANNMPVSGQPDGQPTPAQQAAGALGNGLNGARGLIGATAGR